MSVVLAVLAAALISSFLSVDFGFNLESIPTFVGFALGLSIVLVVFELPPLLMRWQRTREIGRLRVLPWALVVAAAFVLVSRIFGLQPGYLYGLVLSVSFSTPVEPVQEARETGAGMLATLALALAAWLLLDGVRGGALSTGEAASTVISTATAAVVVSGLEAVAFGMLPLRFMPGRVVYTWHRPIWALLFGTGIFFFITILIGPTSGYLSELTPVAWLSALGVFGIFGAISLAFWAWFRFRPAPAEA
jgi:hypothetical protein